jgi:CheY-like chemotaxis protein
LNKENFMSAAEAVSADVAPRVLVADDELSIRLLVEHILDQAGYRVELAENGRDALRHVSQSPPDLVITDLFMPDMDGTELIRALSKSNPDLPILAMSGGRSETKTYMRIAQVLGARDLINKPFDIHMLLQSVATCLREHR